MKKMKKNKPKDKMVKKLIAFNIFIILCIANFSCVIPSNSKYISDNQQAIVYRNKLNDEINKKLNIEYLKYDSTYASNLINLKFAFTLEKNKNIKDEEDIYIIDFESSSNCSLSILNSQTNMANLDGKGNLTFNDNYNSVRLILDCNIQVSEDEEIGEQTIKVKIKEQIEGATPTSYKEGTRTVKPSDFPQNIDYITIRYTTDTEFNSILEDWINRYVIHYFGFNDANIGSINRNAKLYIKEYIKNYKVSGNIETLLDIAERFPGIGVYQSEFDQTTYTFYAEENLRGYAETSYRYASEPNTLYFYTTDPEVINDAFDYYLKYYIYQTKTEDYNIVKKYIEALKLDLSKLILNGDTKDQYYRNTFGIAWYDELDGEPLNQLIVGGNLLNYAKNYFAELQLIDISSEENMKAQFKNNLVKLIEQSPKYEAIISSSVLELILSDDSPILVSVSKNSIIEDESSEEEIEEFNDFFIVYDSENDNYVVINVYYDTNSNFNRFDIITIKIPEIYLKNNYNNNGIKVIKDEDKELLNEIVSTTIDDYENEEDYYSKIISVLEEYYETLPDFETNTDSDNPSIPEEGNDIEADSEITDSETTDSETSDIETSDTEDENDTETSDIETPEVPETPETPDSDIIVPDTEENDDEEELEDDEESSEQEIDIFPELKDNDYILEENILSLKNFIKKEEETETD